MVDDEFDSQEEITALDKSRYPCPECKDDATGLATGKKKGQSDKPCPLCAGNLYVPRDVFDRHRRQ